MRRLSLITLLPLACTTSVDQDPFTSLSVTDTDPSASAGDDDDESTGDPTEGTATDDPSATTDPTATTTPADTSEGTGESTGEPGVCGDGVKDPDEACDDMDFGELNCETQGFMGGVLLCNANCMAYSTEACFVCGDGILQEAEACEGTVPEGVTCESEGFTTGTIACNLETCQYDTSGCSLCGNGIVEGEEPCDQDDVGDATCASLGFEAGDLGCLAACSYDYTSCTGGAYIQDFEGGALPAEFTFTGNQNWVIANDNPIAGTWSAASGVITHSQTSGMVLTVNFPMAGTVEFMHEESSESSFDYLRFYVDGVQQQQWSGINAAAMASFPVAAGMHTLEWRYSKDGSINSGSDRVWVDDIVITGGAPG